MPPTLYPCLFYRDANAAIDWLNRAFGFETLANYPGPDGTVAHAEMKLDDGVIMLGTADAQRRMKSPRDLDGINQSIYAYVADPDAHYARAKDAGAKITRDLANATDYESRGYSAEDLEGNEWSFGTYRPG